MRYAGISVVLLMALGLIARDGARATETRPLVAWSGPQSRMEERGCHRISTDAAWTALWLKHVGMDVEDDYDAFYNPAALPKIDFEQCMVVAVFQGRTWNSAGVICSSLQEDGDRILFRFDDKSYQTMETGDRVTPFGIFVLPASKKPILMEENVQNLIGGAPVWKERARL